MGVTGLNQYTLFVQSYPVPINPIAPTVPLVNVENDKCLKKFGQIQ